MTNQTPISIDDKSNFVKGVSSFDITKVSNIPEELKFLNQWVRWIYYGEPNSKGKRDKIPIEAISSKWAESDNPATWGTFQDALANVDKDNAVGIGFMCSETDPYAGIDLDNCITAGKLGEFATLMVDTFDSYTETSPSGTGKHILIKGKLNRDTGVKKNKVEIYDKKRYFAFTGDTDKPKPITDGQEPLDELLELLDDPKPEYTQTPLPKGEGKRMFDLLPLGVIRSAAANHLGNLQIAVQEQSGHNKLLYAAGVAVRGYYLPDDEAFNLLMDVYSPRCKPPWKRNNAEHVKQVWHKISEARKKSVVMDGYYLVELLEKQRNDKKQAKTPNTPDPQGSATDGKEYIPPKPKRTPLKEYLAKKFPPTEYLFDGLIVKGGFTLLAAPSKEGKSTFIRFLVRQLLNRQPLLGRDAQLDKPYVVYLDYETSPPGELQRLFAEQNIASDQIDILEDCYMMTENPVAELEEICFKDPNKPKPNVIIIDILGKFYLKLEDGNAFHEVTKFMESVKMLCRKYNDCSIIGLHHTNKGDALQGVPTNTKDAMKRILGSTAWAANPDCNIVMFQDPKSSSDVTFYVEQRTNKPLDGIHTIYKDGCYTLRDSYELTAKERHIYLTLLEAKKVMSRTAIANTMPHGWKHPEDAIKTLMDKKKIAAGRFNNTDANNREGDGYAHKKSWHLLKNPNIQLDEFRITGKELISEPNQQGNDSATQNSYEEDKPEYGTGHEVPMSNFDNDTKGSSSDAPTKDAERQGSATQTGWVNPNPYPSSKGKV